MQPLSFTIDAKTNLWDVWQGVVLSSGIVSSLLLFYGAHKVSVLQFYIHLYSFYHNYHWQGKRFPVATSFYVYVFIFVSYLVMAIQDMVASKKVSMKIIAAEIIVLGKSDRIEYASDINQYSL